MRQSVGARIGSKIHMSADRGAKEVLPYLRTIFENDPQMASKIAEWLKLDDDMIAFIKGRKEEKETRKQLARGRRAVKKVAKPRSRRVSAA